MNSEHSVERTLPPNLISALLRGFDTIANHLHLILFPLALDLFLWLGPRLSLEKLFQGMMLQVFTLNGTETAEVTDLLKVSQETWMELLQRFNLFSAFSTIPVGVPSLMNGRLPVQTPAGLPATWQMGSFSSVLVLWAAFALTGILLGTLYFKLTAQAALQDDIAWTHTFQHLAWSFAQVFLLTILWGILLVALSIPLSLVVSLVFSTGSWFGQLLLLLLAGFIVWLLLPLLFSAHGIFVNGLRFLASLRQGVRLTQVTLPGTGLFFLSVFVLSQGMNLLWQIPAESSWWSLVGIFGHAFIMTALLASSFVYYRDAERWTRYLINQFRPQAVS